MGMNDDLMTIRPLTRGAFAAPRVAAISSAGQRRPIAVVLGMHRSGTSLCSHILSAMGIDMADDIVAVPSNAKGHWERLEIMEFHERILRLFNRDFFSPLHDFPLPAAWWADPRVCQIRGEIVAFLASRIGDGYFGFKEPRTVRLMPLWYQIFSDLKLAPKVVLCLRNPAQVARSLKERDDLDPALGEYRWLIYMIDFFRYCGQFEICTVEYDDWFENPCTNFEKLKKFLDVEWQQSRADLNLVLSSIIDPALRHDTSHSDMPHEPLVLSLYRLVSEFGREGVTRDEINKFVAEFLGFQISQRPLHQVADSLAVTAARRVELEQHATGLRAEIERRAAAEAELRAEIERRTATEIEMRADIEQRTATETEVRADIERRETTETTLRADLDVLRSKLVEAERRWSESEAARAALEAQMSSMQRQLDAAREVGAAILEALRHDIGTLPDVAHNSAWQALPLQHLKLRARDRLIFDPAVLARGSR
jgi:hypothetical protein